MNEEELKQLWLWHVGPRIDLDPMAPARQDISMNGMRVSMLRRSKRHYQSTFYTSHGPVTLVCQEPNGYKRIMRCEWFPEQASKEMVQEIQEHMDQI